ncbi:MAG: NAD(P)-binding domain-containing protein, partial [Bacteroidales bacterium]|nr:NAD(P)-binding domain-containing protein [Bacteroidales bacterium]
RREANRGHELGSLTVGIIGMGNMGQAFAKRLSGFGCRIIYYDKYLDRLAGLERLERLERVSLETLQQEADVVSFHVPLTDETRHYLDTAFIDAMRKPFYLLNTSRGAVVDTDALAQGLASGKVLGAGLDVLENEDMTKDNIQLSTFNFQPSTASSHPT